MKEREKGTENRGRRKGEGRGREANKSEERRGWEGWEWEEGEEREEY